MQIAKVLRLEKIAECETMLSTVWAVINEIAASGHEEWTLPEERGLQLPASLSSLTAGALQRCVLLDPGAFYDAWGIGCIRCMPEQIQYTKTF